MMRKKERGQTLILILILLATGALMIVPSLQLVITSLKTSDILGREVTKMYAADAAQEYVLWKLTHDDYGAEFEEEEEKSFTLDLCDASVEVTVISRAMEEAGPVALATDDVIIPTATVYPDEVENGTPTTFTYTIRLEQMSEDTSTGLDAIYGVLPKKFGSGGYVDGSSYLRVDGGEWEAIPDPKVTAVAAQPRLQWPASGNFASPIRDFEVRQVKELKFDMEGTLTTNSCSITWVILKPWDTLSGPQAPIYTGDPSPREVADNRLVQVSKDSDPDVIPPGEETFVEYTISIQNLEGFTVVLDSIADYLPPGFSYCGPGEGCAAPSGITSDEPQLTFMEDLNGVDRWKLEWTVSPSMASNEILTQTFWASTTIDASGAYYNEVMVVPDVPVPTIFSGIGVTLEEYTTSYSWNSGAVKVPFYDSRADAGEIVIDANLGLIIGGVAIESWQID
ncbi:hypothetical protein ACFLWY_02855 [Chloroflexota bacterium]